MWLKTTDVVKLGHRSGKREQERALYKFASKSSCKSTFGRLSQKQNMNGLNRAADIASPKPGWMVPGYIRTVIPILKEYLPCVFALVLLSPA
jgi:hypothetical protein